MVRQTKAKYLPDLDLSVHYVSPFGVNFVPTNIAGAGVEFSWEAWDWNRRKHEVNEKNLKVEETKVNLDETKSQVLLSVDKEYRNGTRGASGSNDGGGVSRVGARETARSDGTVRAEDEAPARRTAAAGEPGQGECGLQPGCGRVLVGAGQAAESDGRGVAMREVAIDGPRGLKSARRFTNMRPDGTAKAVPLQNRLKSASLLMAMMVLAGTVGCRQEAAVDKSPPPVRTALVQVIDAGTANTYSANIQPYQQVDLAFKSNGYLASIRQVKDADGHRAQH